jgi:hypothetical protein
MYTSQHFILTLQLLPKCNSSLTLQGSTILRGQLKPQKCIRYSDCLWAEQLRHLWFVSQVPRILDFSILSRSGLGSTQTTFQCILRAISLLVKGGRGGLLATPQQITEVEKRGPIYLRPKQDICGVMLE